MVICIHTNCIFVKIISKIKTDMTRLKFKRGFALVVFAFLFSVTAMAQLLAPAKWVYEAKAISDSEYELRFTCQLEKNWHVYSQFVPENGPIPTSFSFEKTPQFVLVGKTMEPKPKVSYDAGFMMDIGKFSKRVTFVQKIKPLVAEKFVLKGAVEYQVCDDSRCLPPETVEVSFVINPTGKLVEQGSPSETALPTATPAVEIDSSTTSSIPVLSSTSQDMAPKINLDSFGKKSVNLSYWWIFITGFIGGILALLMPCIWPMIPMTVSFFLKQGDKRSKGIKNAMVYGLSIVVIYVALGIGITLIFGSSALNEWSTGALFNLFIFALLVVFSFSFFGAFDIQLPASWVSKIDGKAQKTSGLISIFFMAFTLALVSFSCTGLIIGTLLVEAVHQGIMGPVIGMTGFAIALALPFTLFAIFPSLLKTMPKSGGWLNTLKVVLGFLELALALKFLSIADLAYHWGILDREVFLVLWIVIFSLLGLYLLGKIAFYHDEEVSRVSIPRFIMAIMSFSFALYMVPGLWGAPLSAISAFSPPQSTQDFDLYQEQVHPMYQDYYQAMQYARQVNKPVLIDFTGWGCVNCRNMEVSVWSDPRVKKLIEKEFVLVSLYVDDKTPLPLSEQREVTVGGVTKKIKTIGHKWSHFQAYYFQANSQPFYVMLDTEGKPLVNAPYVYSLNPSEFISFLEEGLRTFKQN